MEVEEHYAKLLRLPLPREVHKVEENLSEQQGRVCLRWPAGAKACCPECGRQAGLYDHLPVRVWRHLNVMQYRLKLCAAVPRCNCPEHGVKALRVPWAEPHSRFTLHFEAFAIAVIEASRSVSQAAKLLGLHWNSVQAIIDADVRRALARRTTEGIRRVGLDGKSPLRGQSYVSLMSDLDGQRILEVIAGRDTQSCVKLWEALPSSSEPKSRRRRWTWQRPASTAPGKPPRTSR